MINLYSGLSIKKLEILLLMDLYTEHTFRCPYCARMNTLVAEWRDEKEYRQITDCEVCCRPILVTFRVLGRGIVDIRIEKENE